MTLLERLREWVETPVLGRSHAPYANPAELKRDIRALLAVVEAAQEVANCQWSLLFDPKKREVSPIIDLRLRLAPLTSDSTETDTPND